MTQNVTQNAETAEENAEKKKKKKKEREEEEEEEEMEISSRPRPRQIQAGDTGPGRAATQFAARRTQVAHLVFFFFFLSSPMKTLVLPLWFFLSSF